MAESYHILVIEDDAAVGRMLQKSLKRDGYGVTWKATGSEGVTFAREQNPHLVILDVRLPDGSGFDFCRQMRSQGLRQPILILTVRRDEVDKVLGLEMGADDYLTKPYNFRELLARVRALLRRAYGELAAAEMEEQADRTQIRPLQVIQHQEQRFLLSQGLHRPCELFKEIALRQA